MYDPNNLPPKQKAEPVKWFKTELISIEQKTMFINGTPLLINQKRMGFYIKGILIFTYRKDLY